MRLSRCLENKLNHFRASMIKSWIRIIGLVALILAEIFGILEEYWDNRKE